jgi:hypothetical protein
MAQLISLSDQDLEQLRGELAAGRSPMVWFTSAAVGVPAGGSAKIVAFADTAEGDYVQVRPTGSKDVLSFSPSELTRTRPPRRRATPPKATRAPRPRAKATEPVAVPAPTPPPPTPPPAPTPSPEVAPKPAARRAVRSAVPKPADVIVTLTSTPSGEWTVDVVVGKKRTVRALQVAPGDIAKAARALPSQVGDAIDASLAAARQEQQDRVARLQAELEQAQRTLKDLE